jgi:5-methylcytosine-specific restriction endonuclease McrA
MAMPEKGILPEGLRKWRERNPDYQSGEKNPFWKGGTSESNICRTVRKILEDANVDQHTCVRCGRYKYPSRQNIHHKDENRLNNTLENLEVLCVRCHNGHAKGARHHRPLNKRDPKTGLFICHKM